MPIDLRPEIRSSRTKGCILTFDDYSQREIDRGLLHKRLDTAKLGPTDITLAALQNRLHNGKKKNIACKLRLDKTSRGISMIKGGNFDKLLLDSHTEIQGIQAKGTKWQHNVSDNLYGMPLQQRKDKKETQSTQGKDEIK